MPYFQAMAKGRKKKTEQVSIDRTFLKMLFVHENLEVPEIVTMTGVPKTTVYYYKSQDNWEEERVQRNLNPRAIAAQLELAVRTLFKKRRDENNGQLILAGGDGDTIHKLLKSRNDILKESNYIGIAFDISDRKIKWLRERYPKLATDDYVNAEHEFLKKLFEDLI